jgi:hypothetical protein
LVEEHEGGGIEGGRAPRHMAVLAGGRVCPSCYMSHVLYLTVLVVNSYKSTPSAIQDLLEEAGEKPNSAQLGTRDPFVIRSN